MSLTFGILLEPPTRTISSMSVLFKFFSWRIKSKGFSNLLNRSLHNSSNFALVIWQHKDLES
jgi:hypothetical protein